MLPVLGRRARNALVAALILPVPLALTASSEADSTVSANIASTPYGQAMPTGFVGTSFEYRAVHQYTGSNPRAVDPVLIALLRGLAPRGAPVLRIGGNSTDATWWPARGVRAPGGSSYRLTRNWMRTTRALANALRARMILGVNLAADRPGLGAAEGKALLQGLGRNHIAALEIGNEPDLYGIFPRYTDRHGHRHWSRSRHYSLRAYTAQFRQWSRVLPRLPLAGPATSGPAWMGNLGRFISGVSRLGVVTYHRYPLRSCVTQPTAAGYASIPNLLADSSSSGLARGVAPYVRVAHAHHRPLRLTELNSASCEGTTGVSDTFASALWALDTLFNLASVGVDGVNFHMLPGAPYELFTPSRTSSGGWQAFVHPEYYGLLMFNQAFPPGARLTRVTSPQGGAVKVWATEDGAGTVRVTLINKDLGSAHDVHLQIAGSPDQGSLETLAAPSASSSSGETLGGQSFGPETTTGQLAGSPQAASVSPAPTGGYDVTVPAASAELLTLPAHEGGAGIPPLHRR